MKGGTPIWCDRKMNKQKTRYTPFKGAYKMPVDEFCERYGLDLRVVMHRMNALYWEDFDALVIPQNVGDTSADKVRRALMLLNSKWTFPEISKRLSLDVEVVKNISQMDDYRKKMFLEMDNYFFLNPAKVDVSKIFFETQKKEVV